MAYFPHAFQKMLLGTNATPFYKTANPTTSIGAGQVGIVDNFDHQVLLVADPYATASYAANPLVYLAQGSFHTNDKLGASFHGGYKETDTHNITTYTNEYGTVADKDQKKSTLSPTEYMKLATEQIDKLYNEVETAIENIRKMIAKDGIVIEHMYSAEGGEYEVKGSSSKAETNVKDDTIQEDSKEKIFEDLAKILSVTSMNKIKALMEGCK